MAPSNTIGGCRRSSLERGLRVLKFGGTSVASVTALRQVASIVEEARRSGPTVVVVSAIRGVTDDLHLAVQGLPSPLQVRELRSRLRQQHLQYLESWLLPQELRLLEERLEPELDRFERALAERNSHEVLAVGERLSVVRLDACLRRQGLWPEVFDGTRVLQLDESGSVHRKPLHRGLALLKEAAGRIGGVALVSGFIAGDSRGRTVTLGRGASDLSATALSAHLGAERVEIWTDTPGILTADPRYVRGAVTLPRRHPEEATALARYGAKVVHAEAMRPLRGFDLAIRVLSTMDRQHEGTEITSSESTNRDDEEWAAREVRAVTVLELEDAAAWPDHSSAIAVLTPPGTEERVSELVSEVVELAGRRVQTTSVEEAGPSRLLVTVVSGGAAEALLPHLHGRLCRPGSAETRGARAFGKVAS